MTDMHRALMRREFENREQLLSHLPYERENQFYRAIQTGDEAQVTQLFMPLGQEGFGVLSEDALRNLKYHLIITVAFITRYCIGGGMAPETASNLSDLYIRRVDRCDSAEQIHALHRELTMDYTARMRAMQGRAVFSRPVTKCTEYIHTHLHTRITIEALCGVSGLSRSYLSELFRREVGMPVMQYVTERRLEAARQELELSERPVSDIALHLGFCSQSHFTACFRRRFGMTPAACRRASHPGFSGAGSEHPEG